MADFTIGQEVIISLGGDRYELAKITGETETRWKVDRRQFYKSGSNRKHGYRDLNLVGGYGIKLLVGKPTPELRKKVAATLKERQDAADAATKQLEEREAYDKALAEWRLTPAGLAQTARALHLEGLDIRITKREDPRYRKATVAFVGVYYPDHTANDGTSESRAKIQWNYEYASVEVQQSSDWDWKPRRVFWEAPQIRCSFTASPQASTRFRQLLEEAEAIAVKWDADTGKDIVEETQEAANVS